VDTIAAPKTFLTDCAKLCTFTLVSCTSSKKIYKAETYLGWYAEVETRVKPGLPVTRPNFSMAKKKLARGSTGNPVLTPVTSTSAYALEQLNKCFFVLTVVVLG
jgi:hypothetical protein